MRLHVGAGALCALAVIVGATPARATNQFYGPSPYLQTSDSPFISVIGSPGFYLDTFESGALSVPGVTPSTGAVFPPSGITDSVDADDGVVDGLGTGGHSFFSANGPVGITFTFDAVTLGGLPTAAGIVWTDGSNDIHFEAFDQNNASLGTLDASSADGSNVGTTAEDRFFGVYNSGGISSIFIQNGGGGIEVDHLQFGAFTPSVPEPASLSVLALGGLALLRRRR